MEIKQRIKNNKKENVYSIESNTGKSVNRVWKKESEKDKTRFFFSFQLASELGFVIVIPLLIGTFLGFYLDKHFATKPVFVLIGVTIGIVVSMVNLIRIINRIAES